MSRKKFYKTVINPFEDYAERQLLVVGLVLFLGAVLLSYVGQLQFFGILKIIPTPLTFIKALYTLCIDVTLLTLFLSAYAYLENNKARIVDCFNVVLISSSVMYGLAALTLFSPVQRILDRIMVAINSGDMKLSTLQSMDLMIITFFGLISILLLLYFFYLVVIGIKLAMNGKKLYQGFVIVILVILADATSKFLIQMIP